MVKVSVILPLSLFTSPLASIVCSLFKDIRFLHYEYNLLVMATSSSNNSTQVIIRIMRCVFIMNQEKEGEREREAEIERREREREGVKGEGERGKYM